MTTVAVAGDGVALLYAAIILLVLTWVTVSIRVCVRIWRKVLGMDDYLMVVGLVRLLRLRCVLQTDNLYRCCSLLRLVFASSAASMAPGNGLKTYLP